MTLAERQFQDALRQMGCIICRLEGRPGSPADIHHMLSGGRRMGEMYVLPLCYQHHRSGRNDERVTSRDQCQRRFELRYGKESELLEKCREIVLRMQQPKIVGMRLYVNPWKDRPDLDMSCSGLPLKPGT